MIKRISSFIISILGITLASALLAGCNKKDIETKNTQTTLAANKVTESTSAPEKTTIAEPTTKAPDTNSLAKAAYEDFLAGKISLTTDSSFKDDDHDYNNDCVKYGSYTLNDLKTHIEANATMSAKVMYTYINVGTKKENALAIRMQSTNPSFLSWTGIVCHKDGKLYLSDYYMDGYRTSATLYDNGILKIGGSSGAGANGFTLKQFDNSGKGTDIFTENQYTGIFAASIIFDLNPDSTGFGTKYDDISSKSRMTIREYIADNKVKISVSDLSSDTEVNKKENELIQELITAGAELIDDTKMDKLTASDTYAGKEIQWITHATNEVNSTTSTIASNSAVPKTVLISSRYATIIELSDTTFPKSYVADNSDNSVSIIFTLSDSVSDFTFYNISYKNIATDGTMEYTAQSLKNIGTVTPADKVLLQMVFIGDTANMGFSFKDSNGVQHNYAIDQSGKDGSVVITSCHFSN